MKKRNQFFLLFVVLSIFVTLRVIGFARKKTPSELQQDKPVASEVASIRKPSYFSLEKDRDELFSHPWLKKQKIEKLSPGILRDISDLEIFCAEISRQHPELSPAMVTDMLIEKLSGMQEKVPFAFSEEFYNVLFITEPSEKPYKVYQRLYLGDSSAGFPVYLDVRVYKTDSNEKAEDILKSYFSSLKETSQQNIGKDRYFITGKSDAQLDVERGLFFYPKHIDGILYVAVIDAPLNFFKENENFFIFLNKIT